MAPDDELRESPLGSAPAEIEYVGSGIPSAETDDE
jgi:hypothetical protein